MGGHCAVGKAEEDYLGGVALVPTPGEVPGEGVRADGVLAEGVAHHVEVVDAHVGEEHIGLGDVVRAGRVGPIDVERDIELADWANEVLGEQAASRARQAVEPVVLGDHVRDAGSGAGVDYAPGRLVIVAEGLFPEQVQASGKSLHGDFFVGGRRRHVEDEVGLHSVEGLAEVVVYPVGGKAEVVYSALAVLREGFDAGDHVDI